MKSNSAILIIALVIVAGGALWYFSGQEGNDPSLTSSVPSLDNPAQTQFQTLVSQLQPISFDTSIFSDPRFTSLIDLTTPIMPEASGRIDPFAPIGAADN